MKYRSTEHCSEVEVDVEAESRDATSPHIMQATHIRIKRGYVEVEVAKWQSSKIEK